MKKEYLVALGITVIIFLVGIFTGWLISKSKVLYIEGLFNQIRKNIGNVELEFLFIDTFKENITCSFLLSEFSNILQEDDDLRHKLEIYEQATNIDTTETVFNLKREYTITLLRYWLFVMKLNKICNAGFTTVLYFFSENCKDCPMQGFYLTYFKNKEKDKIMVFAIQSNIGLPFVTSLISSFNVTVFPTLVINEKDTYMGLKEKDELSDILCSYDDFNFCSKPIAENETISLPDTHTNQSTLP